MTRTIVRHLAVLAIAAALLIGLIVAAVPAQAHSGVRFQLSSASEAGTYVRYHGPDGVVRSKLVTPGSSLTYPSGGHLIDVRVKWGWTISGIKNGSTFRFTCNRVADTYDGTYCRHPLWGSYVARYRFTGI